MRIDILSQPQAARLGLYNRLLELPFNYAAVFSDESPEYLVGSPPMPGETIRVKLRLPKDQSAEITLVVNGKDVAMAKAYTEGYFDFYEAKLQVWDAVRYFFRIKAGNGEFYYDKMGLREGDKSGADFIAATGIKAPDWAKGAVMYQIYVDRFNNGDPTNDVVNNEYAYLGRAAKHADWDDPVQNDDICNFYGGDLRGVINKLPYLKELGIEALYLNPIFVSPSAHKYDIQDYDYVDPHFGSISKDGGEPLYFEKFKNAFATKYAQRVTKKENLEGSNALFSDLVEKAHKLGIKVILDGVFNHCGAFNKWLDREGFYERNGYAPGAYRNENSQYKNYFRWESENWPNNEDYESWWGHKNHPKLCYEDSKELYDYIMGVAEKWVSPPFNADGWRLDVAADLGFSQGFNHRFWRDFKNAVKSANPQAVIIAEHYGDPSPWLIGGEWDTVMNYDAFMEPLTWFLCGIEKHSESLRPDLFNNPDAFLAAMRQNMAKLPGEALYSAMNQLSNHDHSRFLTRTNKTTGRLHTKGRRAASIGINKSIMFMAVLVQMTWPGSPCIYYGDEAGLTGWTDPDNRKPYPWGNEDMDILNFHKDIIAIRKKSPAARLGSLEILGASEGYLCYARKLKEDRLITVINNTGNEKAADLPVWKLNVREGVFIKQIETKEGKHSMEAERLEAKEGFLPVTIPALGGAVFRMEQER